MNVLLELNKGEAAGLRLIANLHTKSLRKRVITLLSEERKKEAIDLIVAEAMVSTYVPVGKEPSVKPEITLVEDK